MEVLHTIKRAQTSNCVSFKHIIRKNKYIAIAATQMNNECFQKWQLWKTDLYWPDPKDCPYYCLRLFVCVCVCVCVSVVHPSSAQVLQSILMKLGHMDHWGT